MDGMQAEAGMNYVGVAGVQAPERADGLRMCPGCEDVLVSGGGYCRDCTSINSELEALRLRGVSERASALFAAVPREQAGVIEWPKQMRAPGEYRNPQIFKGRGWFWAGVGVLFVVSMVLMEYAQ